MTVAVPPRDYGGVNPAYIVPTEGGNDPHFHDSPIAAYSPNLRSEVGGTPDPMRTGQMRRRDFRPTPADPPENFWLGVNGPGREVVYRHGVEYQDADGFVTEAPHGAKFAPNPRSTPPPEPRATSRMSPRTYTFTRPFDVGIARQFNGSHFSMADHRRDYPILGMEPVRRRRNTFRAEPAPWDSDLVDMPNPAVTTPRPGPVVAFDVPATRNWRLT